MQHGPYKLSKNVMIFGLFSAVSNWPIEQPHQQFPPQKFCSGLRALEVDNDVKINEYFDVNWLMPKNYSTLKSEMTLKLRLHFEGTKVHQKCLKSSIWRVFEKLLKFAVEVLPDKSILIGQNFWVIFKHCGVLQSLF